MEKILNYYVAIAEILGKKEIAEQVKQCYLVIIYISFTEDPH
jgi:hypothetical protein